MTVAPAAPEVAAAESRIAARSRSRARLRTAAALDCRTADGERIEVFANVGSTAEAAAAVASGAEGCGLLRTEFLFLDRLEPPEASRAARAIPGARRRVLGPARRRAHARCRRRQADPLPAMPPEDNPALGLRGMRASLWRPELLRAQITAILSVRPANRCRILLPMVNEPAEIEAVRAMIREIAAGLRANADIPVGIMIETPAAAIAAARLAAHADFFSIGTNDLTQYTLAIDRAHPLLADGLDAMHPAVLDLIAARRVGGARGGTRRRGLRRARLGPRPPPRSSSGSASASSRPSRRDPAIKDAVRRRTLAECRELAARALALESAAAVRALLAESDPGERS